MTGASAYLQRAVDALEPIYGIDSAQNLPLHGLISHTEQSSCSSSPPAAASTPQPLYQTQLVDSFMRSPGNEVLFLPTGLGESNVVDEIARQMLQRYPEKHVVVCVVRPAQALSHADRLRAALGVEVGAFCGGDFLYNFEEEFKRNKVVVFTAGLLMRLAKLGTYKLEWASLLVLHDAFSAVRNHPMNTLVREYYWKGPAADAGADKPRILGVVLPQLQQLQRPFDKLRQLVRKLCHSAQAGVLVPTGPALEALAQRVHRAHVAMHGYDLTSVERQLGEALQTHSLLIWDTLHAFGQNHFGRLIHFPPSASPQQSPRTIVGGLGGPPSGASHVDNQGQGQQQAQPLPPSHAARLAAQLALSQGGSPASSSPAGIGSPASLGSPAQHDTPPQKTAAPGSVAPPNAAPYAFDPVHHDWKQIELMVRHSISCSEALSPPGVGNTGVSGQTADVVENAQKVEEESKHPRSDVALAVMHHVLRCAEAIQTGMELGVGPCLTQLLPALKEFRDALDAFSLKFNQVENKEQHESSSTGLNNSADNADIDSSTTQKGGSVDEQLLAKVLHVLPTSPLLQWLSMNGGRKELSSTMGSRMGSLLDVLEEVLRHAEAEGLFRSYMNTGSGADGFLTTVSVAVVVGNEASRNAVQTAIGETPELDGTTVSRWKGATEPEKEINEEKEVKTDGKMDKDQHLAISLLTSEEATSHQGRKFISQCNEAVWFSATDVLHAAGFNFESAALGFCYRESAVGSVNYTSTGAVLTGPECHILATGAQTAAWLEVCRADQLLLAAMQLVQAGDASFEGYLGQMMTNSSTHSTWENMSVPPPAAILHTLCLGLCGTPPQFHISKNPSSRQQHQKHFQAVAVLPEGLLAPGNYALPVAFGSEEIACQGSFEDSEAEARDAAAEVALAALVECGLVAAYWQTRALLVQSQQLAAAVVVDLSEKMHTLVVSGPEPGVMPPSPFVDAAARSISPTRRPGTGGGTGDIGEVANNAPVPTDRLICRICGIVTTSEGHLKEHLAGRRHLKNLERLQQQQQGAVAPGHERFAASAAGGGGGDVADQENNTDGGAMSRIDNNNNSKNETGPEIQTPPPPRRTKSGISRSTSSIAGAEGGATPSPQLTTLSTIDRLPSSLSDAFLRRSSSLHRHSSGNVYEGFPCVRVGDVILPSSMDLRAFLDEMQQAGELDLPGGSGNILGGGLLDSLPSIGETTTTTGTGATTTIRSGGGGPSSTGISKHVTTPISSTSGAGNAGNSTSSNTAAAATAGASGVRVVPPLSFRGGTSTGMSGDGGGGHGGSYHSRERSGRPPPAPRPGSVYRTGSGNLGGSSGGGGLVYSNQYNSGGGAAAAGGGHHYQQQQQQNSQQRGWNSSNTNSLSNQRGGQRYPSRFSQDPGSSAAAIASGREGGGAGGGPGSASGGTAGAVYGVVPGGGEGVYPSGMMTYQRATPLEAFQHPHHLQHHHHLHHGQHLMQQPIAFIPAGMSVSGYPTAVASPSGMSGVAHGGPPGHHATAFVAIPASPGALMSPGPGQHSPNTGQFYQHHMAHPHHQQYPPHQYPPNFNYQQPQHQQHQHQQRQYYGMRSQQQQPPQSHSPQQRSGTSWRQQQQQQQ